MSSRNPKGFVPRPPARRDAASVYVRDTPAGPDLVREDANGNLWVIDCTDADLGKIVSAIMAYRKASAEHA